MIPGRQWQTAFRFRTSSGLISRKVGQCLALIADKARLLIVVPPTEFWELGYKLFNDSPEKFPAAFIAGNAFDPAHIAPTTPFTEVPSTPTPDLRSLTSLNPLLGHVSAIHASAFFHLFEEAEQAQLARSIAGLLSPEPGSLIFGSHGGAVKKGYRDESSYSHSGGSAMWCHSPESWTDLWDGQIFPKGTVKVDAVLIDLVRKDLPLNNGQYYVNKLLVWSVTRL